MGRHKKRNPASPAAPPASPSQLDESSLHAIKLYFEKALTAFRVGSHTKSLRLIKEAGRLHATSPLVHRFESSILFKVAGTMGDHTAKHRFLRLAIDSAKQACSLSPKSLEFAHYYANLLFHVAAQEGRGYEEVVWECERALAIENPIDLARRGVQGELSSLIQKANDFGAGSGEEHTKALLRLLIHKVKTDERRKEIGARVFAETKGKRKTRKDQVKCYWNSMSYDQRSSFLRVSVGDMMEHFASSKDKDKDKDKDGSYEVLREALMYGKLNRKWKLCMCFECGETFVDVESHVKHVFEHHMGSASVDRKKAIGMLRCTWRDLRFTAPLLRPHWSPPVRFDKCSLDSRENHNYVKLDCITCCNQDQDNVEVVQHILRAPAPLSDPKSSDLLFEKVVSLFQFLIPQNCLSMGLLIDLIVLIVRKLRTLAPGSPILSSGIDHMCFTFLGSSRHLREIITHLHRVSMDCGVSRYTQTENIRGPDDTTPLLLDSQDQLVLSEDASFFLLDESLLPNDVLEAGPSAGVGIRNSTTDSLLSWIFAGPSTGEQLAMWSRTREGRKVKAPELHRLLEKEFVHLQKSFESKFKPAGRAVAVQELEQLCTQEGNKFSYLRKLGRELDCRGFLANPDIFQLRMINDILEEAESTESIEIAMQRKKDHLSLELSKTDESTKQSVDRIRKLEDELESVSQLDYSSVLLPLVKSFLQEKLKDGEPPMWMDYCCSSYDDECIIVSDSEDDDDDDVIKKREEEALLLRREAELEAEAKAKKKHHVGMCKEALTALQRGGHVEALHLIKEATQKHELAPLLHRCHATICVKVAEIKDDQTEKQRYLMEGIDSARKACSLSPNSVEFAHFYANLLYEEAKRVGKDDYTAALLECDRALAIENPIDPAEESFQEEQQMFPTAEERIHCFKYQLRLIKLHIFMSSEEFKKLVEPDPEYDDPEWYEYDDQDFDPELYDDPECSF